MEQKIQKGFQGEKIISLPELLLAEYAQKYPTLFHLYITHIGYFPKASFHFREWPQGCTDNIFFYCTQGSGWIIIDDKKIQIQTNQYYILKASDSYIAYGATSENPWTIFWIHFKGAELADFNASLAFQLPISPQNIAFDPDLITAWEHMYDCLNLGYSLENLCNANFSLFQFLAKILFTPPSKSLHEDSNKHLSNSTILYMKENINKRLCVEDFAKRVHQSNSYFSNNFRKQTGMAPMDYFIYLKMQKACQQLFLSNQSVKEIAFHLGYEDPFYFSRIFKRCMGTSPLQYRNDTRSPADAHH